MNDDFNSVGGEAAQVLFNGYLNTDSKVQRVALWCETLTSEVDPGVWSINGYFGISSSSNNEPPYYGYTTIPINSWFGYQGGELIEGVFNFNSIVVNDEIEDGTAFEAANKNIILQFMDAEGIFVGAGVVEQ